MWPTLFDAGGEFGVGVHTYGLFILAAFCSAFVYVHVMAGRVGIHPDRLIAVYIAAAVGGLSGGRILYAVAVDWEKTLSDPASLASCSGFAYYGGMIGGTIAVFAVARVMKINAWKLADIAGPALVLGLGVGRLGCFFAGCCHGAPAPIGDDPTALLGDGVLGGQIWLDSIFPFLSLEFHGGVGRIHHTPLYPTQLWSATVGIGMWALLAATWNWRRFDGQNAVVVLLIEPVFRILIETFRADHRGTTLQWEVSGELAKYLPGMTSAGADLQDGATTAVVGLTTSQTIGLGLVVIGFVVLALRFNAGVAPEIPVDYDEDDDDDFDDDFDDDDDTA